MIKQFEKLTKEETKLLLMTPAFVSVLATCENQEINREGKAEAVKLSHLKTYTAIPLLLPFYREVEKDFEIYFETIVKKYAPFDDAKREALKNEINTINTVISKLDKDFAKILHKSFSGYAEHVKNSEKRFLDTFIFPIPIPGLSD